VTESDEVLTIEECASILKATPRQIYELCRTRSQERAEHPFPCFKIHAKMLRVRKRDLFNWIDKIASHRRGHA
jgi:hypothetical protein